MPANCAGDILVELLFSQGFKPVYHLENPSRQPWPEILHVLASELGGASGPLPLIPFSDWLALVHALGKDPTRNIAVALLDFLEHDFIRLASGSLMLGTAASIEDSPTMAGCTPVNERLLKEYVTYWKQVGALL